MSVPLTWLLVTFNCHISGASGIIETLSLRRSWLGALLSLLLLLLFFNFPNDIGLFVLKTLLAHDVVISTLDTNADLSCGSTSSVFSSCTWLCEGVHTFGGKLASIESALVVLVLSVDDLFVAEVFHGVFLWSTHFHLFNEFLLASDPGSLSIRQGVVLVGGLIWDIIQ